MEKITILHNPRCGKSRQTLKLVEEKVGENSVRIIKYLETPLKVEELRGIIEKLAITPDELVRKQEKLWKEEFKEKNLTDEELIQVMVENPILMERPIVLNGNKAVLCRPPENVLDIL